MYPRAGCQHCSGVRKYFGRLNFIFAHACLTCTRVIHNISKIIIAGHAFESYFAQWASSVADSVSSGAGWTFPWKCACKLFSGFVLVLNTSFFFVLFFSRFGVYRRSEKSMVTFCSPTLSFGEAPSAFVIHTAAHGSQESLTRSARHASITPCTSHCLGSSVWFSRVKLRDSPIQVKLAWY